MARLYDFIFHHILNHSFITVGHVCQFFYYYCGSYENSRKKNVYFLQRITLELKLKNVFSKIFKYCTVPWDFEISYVETAYRILFYIKMSIMMSWILHKGLKSVCQAMAEIFVRIKSLRLLIIQYMHYSN